MSLDSLGRSAGVSTLARRFAILLWLLLVPSAALAQSCTVTPAPGNYGSVDILAGAAVNTSSTFSVSCTGVAVTMGICIQFDQGSPNSNTSIR